MSIRDRINQFRDEWQAAGERLDEIHAKRPKQPVRQLTDEEIRERGEQSVLLDQQQGLTD